jgi:uncharacterized lipoprotein NlpE involved in copper resistance
MSEIKFNHAPMKALSFNGATCATPIMALSAVYSTMSAKGEFATDIDGLEQCRERTDSAVLELSDYVEALGDLMLHVDEGALDAATSGSTGKLLKTLANQITYLTNMRIYLDNDLLKREAQIREGGA